MPGSAITKASIAQLKFAYISAVLILFLLLLGGQGLIQMTLHQESMTRTLATVLHNQELATQQLLRDSILLLLPGEDHQSTVAEMQSDLAFLTSTNALLTATGQNVPSSAMQHYLKTIEGAQQLLRDEHSAFTSEKARFAAQYPAFTLIFQNDHPYLMALNHLFSTLNSEADKRVSDVQLIEIVIFALSLFTILAELFLVVKPALQHLSQHLAFIAAQLQTKNHDEPSADKT